LRLRLGFYGFGAIGRMAAKVALERGHDIAGAMDVREDLTGRDVGELLGAESLGVKVSRDLKAVQDADAVIHATSSYLDSVYDQLVSLLRMGVPVVSSCETLSYPYYRYPVLAKRLNEISIATGAPVIGTGINPGFLLDTLPAVLASSVTAVTKIKARRSLDALKRREPFMKKIGLGEEPEAVERKLKMGEITGHVGYAESVFLIAQAADLNLSRVEEGYSLVPAERDFELPGGRKIERGKNLGMKGYGSGFVGSREVIRVEFEAYAGAPEFEEISIEGKDYSVSWRSTGTPGDLGTASMLVSTAERIVFMPPGLHLMTELLPFKIKFSVG